MPGSKPQKVVIEFDDGSKREASFELLPSPLQFELLRQPFASQAQPEPRSREIRLTRMG